MNRFLALGAGLAALVPGTAYAECVPTFAGGPATVTLSPGATFDGQQLAERFLVNLRNDGDSACEVRLSVARDANGSGASFPDYILFGPNGSIPALPLGASSRSADASVLVKIPAGKEVSVPYQVRTSVGWGDESGEFSEELVYSLANAEDSAEVATQRAELRLSIPAVAYIRFAGVGRSSGNAQLQMGELSSTAPTTSPPFAIRVLSTSGYQMVVYSEHSGALQRKDGPESIPYRMTVGGRVMNMAGAGDTLSKNTHTGPTGDLFPVSVVINPDATRHAGDYSDRVTVTVTPI